MQVAAYLLDSYHEQIMC